MPLLTKNQYPRWENRCWGALRLEAAFNEQKSTGWDLL